MDSHNLFLTRTTYRLLRAEYGAALIAAAVVALIHLGHIRWPVFIGMFVYIDLIGYLPGAVAHRRARSGDIRRGFHVLYNSMHSFLSAGAWPARGACSSGRSGRCSPCRSTCAATGPSSATSSSPSGCPSSPSLTLRTRRS